MLRRIQPHLAVAYLGLLLCALICSQRADAATGPTPSRVLIVYNSNWTGDADNDGVQDSLQVATYYAQKRGVPASNILGVPCTNGGIGSGYYYYYTGEWPQFYSEVIQPIQAKLTTLGPTNIDVLLMCTGVPHEVYAPSSGGVSVDNVLMGLNGWAADGSNVYWSNQPYMDLAPTFSGGDAPHFDHSIYKFNGTNMYLVSRLDSPRGVNGVMDLVDQALYGERYIAPGAGYYNGNVYVDSRNGQGGGGTLYTDAYLATQPAVTGGGYYSYGDADMNMAYAEHYVQGTGYTLKWENSPWSANIGQAGALYSDGTSGLTAPKAMLYGGWYNFGAYNDVWSWLPGSIACDLNSNSLDGRAIRNSGAATAFGSKAIERGATCVSGVIDEPYLNGHPRPNILLYYVLKGYDFAEAAALATPTIGWMPINIGDPLYAPMGAKTPVKDTVAPNFSAGFPYIGLCTTGPNDRLVSIKVGDSPEPEVVQAVVDYGLDTNYGSSVNSGQGYWRRIALTLPALQANSLYHYRVTVTDPVGNVTTSGDLTFDTGNLAAPAITSTAPTAGYVGVIYTYNATATGNPVPQWKIGSGPPGMSVDHASGAVTWRPAATGTFSVTLIADNGVGTPCTQTFSITVTNPPTYTLTVVHGSGSGTYVAGMVVSISADNAPAGQGFSSWSGPEVADDTAPSTTLTMPAANSIVTAVFASLTPAIVSAASATPSRAAAATPVIFNISASAPGNAVLTYTWDFGDQSSGSGSSSSHTYAAAGTYTATVTISDGNGHSATSSVQIVIDPVGTIEAGGGGTPPAPLALKLSSVKGSMKSTGGHDACSVSGILPNLSALFQPKGATVILDVGGATNTFVLDAKGHAKNDHGTFALALKFKHVPKSQPTFAGGDVKFSAQLKNGAWAAAWAADNMNVNATAPLKNAAASVLITVTLNGQPYQITAATVFSANAGHGAFKNK
jgi:uncharacterized protein (TIGR03790 family)